MRVEMNTPISELYHSDDELMHWKYFKREKVNGKWKYTYKKKDDKSSGGSSGNSVASRLFKYIKREKVDGKWKYTYKTPTNDKTKTTNLTSTNAKTGSSEKTTERKFKYVKREKVNGKWRYWYDLDSVKKKVDDMLGVTAKNDLKIAEEKANKAKRALGVGKKIFDEVRDKVIKDNYISNAERSDVEAARKLYDKRVKQEEEAGKDYVAKNEAYLDTPLGKLENLINKGKEFIYKDKNEIRLRDEEWKKQADAELEQKRKERYDEAVRETEERNLKIAKDVIRNLDKANPLRFLRTKDREYSNEEDMAAVNPKYNPETYGKDRNDLYDENCAVCTLAYDMRRRGYDVTAASEEATKDDPNRTVGLNSLETSLCYNDPGAEYKTNSAEHKKVASKRIVTSDDIMEKYNYTTYDVTYHKDDIMKSLENDMLSHGEGARGELGVYWKIGGGHSMVWEVQNNNVIIRDCQTNKTYELEAFTYRIKDFDYIRTDNLEPNENMLKYVRNWEE